MQIDTSITAGMHEINAGNPIQPEVNIIVRNLQAGIDANLKSGWDYYDEIRSYMNQSGTHIASKKIDSVEGLQFTEDDGVTPKNMPLWLYILSEASLQQQGKCLGIVGSTLVAEVIRNSIAGSNISLFDPSGFKVSARAIKRFASIKKHIDTSKPESVLSQIARLID